MVDRRLDCYQDIDIEEKIIHHTPHSYDVTVRTLTYHQLASVQFYYLDFRFSHKSIDVLTSQNGHVKDNIRHLTIHLTANLGNSLLIHATELEASSTTNILDSLLRPLTSLS